MSKEMKFTFLEDPAPPATGERTSTMRIGDTQVKLYWKDGMIEKSESVDPSTPQWRIQRFDPPKNDPQGEIIKTCWTCYEDTVSMQSICLKEICPPPEILSQ